MTHSETCIDRTTCEGMIASRDQCIRAQANLIHDGREILLAIHEHFRHWNAPDPSALFDDNRTLKQAVEEYLTRRA